MLRGGVLLLVRSLVGASGECPGEEWTRLGGKCYAVLQYGSQYGQPPCIPSGKSTLGEKCVGTILWR